jgi:hypothetical protein
VLRAYAPGPLDAELTVVRAAATVPAPAWDALALRPPRTVVLPGDHYGLLEPPVVAALAAACVQPAGVPC